MNEEGRGLRRGEGNEERRDWEEKNRSEEEEGDERMGI